MAETDTEFNPPASESSSSYDESVQVLLDSARRAREAEDERNRYVNKTSAELSAKAAKEFDESEQGAVHRQIDEAERQMRGPHPTPGNTPGDPSKGPSS